MEIPLQTSPNGCPAFFENAMLLDLEGAGTGHDSHQTCPDMFDLLPDFDSGIVGNSLFGENFIPDLEQIVQNDFLLPVQENEHHLEREYLNSTKRRVYAFQRSFWWEGSQNTGNGDTRLVGSSELEPSVLSPHSIPSNLTFHEKLSSRLRDELFRLIVKTGDDTLSIPELPTVDHLDILIKIGLAKKVDINPWIHLYTFYSNSPRPELIAALVSTGCISCLTPTMNKTGIIMQEVVRVALRNLSEADIEVTRDLQYLQASMMWLEIGFSCGYRRNMRMTEGALQALGIALRRLGAFDSSSYKPINPCEISDDDASTLDYIWKQWIKQESFKRLVYYFFCHDIEVAAAMNQPPTTSFAELTLSLPAARDLWLAPTASTWKDIWTARYQPPRPEISLRDLLSDPTLLRDLPMHLDNRVASSALLHGLLGKAWDLRQQMLLGRRSASRQPARKLLLLQSRQEDLYTDLQQIRDALVDSPPLTTLMAEFSIMYLHIDIDALQRFAGKLGEDMARQSYPDLRDWSMTQDARIAVWHAGQVFRAVHRVGPYQLRGFDIFAIYYASLTLYVYGLLVCAQKKSTEAVETWKTEKSALVFLDGPSSRATESFVAHNRGQPVLTYIAGPDAEADRTFCSLQQPRLVMRVALQVLNSNFSKLSSLGPANNPIPPLVMNLRGLLHELANLP
ncbi:hypothetical protein BO83DRAFT_321137 [Aspergillus eucalypticola CBS 122712]|uniref:Xylanolytic transcriptional activator regulatory domain-containing protein n=1 Tax=Aspergillus eucalypticola (strain CBS 122712 / IBT 29274) TaxID=1448314 RepID=A0A317UZQ4_ASPEC|nr:uncharacterized protein BO83DRAFT_321137 [Aspergillus eucalypticola CBS 122712]PWY65410.1 hypothetical protein BO83DRAFT_321137 [Aspergillus eucalypticola CBS 122712]